LIVLCGATLTLPLAIFAFEQVAPANNLNVPFEVTVLAPLLIFLYIILCPHSLQL
jgi:hypothetical protein